MHSKEADFTRSLGFLDMVSSPSVRITWYRCHLSMSPVFCSIPHSFLNLRVLSKIASSSEVPPLGWILSSSLTTLSFITRSKPICANCAGAKGAAIYCMNKGEIRPTEGEGGMEYLWKSSIPEKWVQLKGKRFFRRAAKEKEAENKRFSGKVIKTRVISPIPNPLPVPSLPITPHLHSATIAFDPPPPLHSLISAQSLPSFRPYMREKTKKQDKTGFLHVLELGTSIGGNTSSEGKIKQPKALIAVKRKSKEEEGTISPIDSFLHRFDSPDSSIPLQPQSRRGVTGWKISKMRLQVLSPSQSERQVLKTGRTEGRASRFVGYLGPKEPYLEYVRRKWGQDGKLPYGL